MYSVQQRLFQLQTLFSVFYIYKHIVFIKKATTGAAVSFSGKSLFTDFCAQTGQKKNSFSSKSQIFQTSIIDNAKNPRNILQLKIVMIQGFNLYLLP